MTETNLAAPARPRTKPAAIRRIELMDAAQALFLRKGIAATSVDEIVAAAGVAKGTFYLHFATKEHLLAALRERFVADFRDDLQKAVDRRPAGDWTGKLHDWIATAVRCHFERLALHDVVFHDFRVEDRRTRHEGNVIVDQLASFLEQGMHADAWSVDDPRLMAVMLFNAFHGAVDDILPGEPGRRHAKLIRSLDAFFRRAVALS